VGRNGLDIDVFPAVAEWRDWHIFEWLVSSERPDVEREQLPETLEAVPRPGMVLAGRSVVTARQRIRFGRSTMSRLLVRSFSISIDGFGAGLGQSLEHPLGVGGPELFDWFFHTRTWQRMHGNRDGETGVDDHLAAQGFEGVGAWILGRNMFGPVRGPWPDEAWRGWWGEEPPYHTPVFVLTHYPRAPLAMKGGTEFRFVTEGIAAALEQATATAGGKDVRLGGGVATIRQYLLASLIDELHLVISPVLLGNGEHLLEGIDMPALGYECVQNVAGARAVAHVFLRKRLGEALARSADR
jgi:dihydrofolate reductase